MLAREREAEELAQNGRTGKRLQECAGALLHIGEAAHGVQHHELVDRVLQGTGTHHGPSPRVATTGCRRIAAAMVLTTRPQQPNAATAAHRAQLDL